MADGAREERVPGSKRPRMFAVVVAIIVFILYDNPDGGLDSRNPETYPSTGDIHGKAVFRLKPIGNFGIIR
jgi:hypothetical protein